MLWLLKLSPYRRAISFSYHSKFTGVVPLVFLKNFSFAFVIQLNVWQKKPSFQLVLDFYMPSSLSFTSSSFWFKLSDVWTLPFTWTVRGKHWVINCLISILLFLGHRETQREKERQVKVYLEEQSEHTHFPVKFTVLYGCGVWHTRTITRVASKTNDHRSSWWKRGMGNSHWFIHDLTWTLTETAHFVVY